MKKILLFLVMITISACNKPNSVLICGDHVCVNKAEAEQYFEENLSLEVKIIDKKKSNTIDLIELNLKSSSEGEKQISVLKKKNTNKELKILSNDEIEKKKNQLKKRKKIKKKEIKKIKEAKLIKNKKKKKTHNNIVKTKKIVNNSEKKIADICTILKKCSIDEISKYLIKEGKEKKFPDITIRENK